MPSIPQHEVWRRSTEAARLLAEQPQRAEELCQALGLDPRGVDRLLRGLRAGGLRIVSRRCEDGRWRYALREVPAWLERAAQAIERWRR